MGPQPDPSPPSNTSSRSTSSRHKHNADGDPSFSEQELELLAALQKEVAPTVDADATGGLRAFVSTPHTYVRFLRAR